MALDISTITGYVNENSAELKAKMSAGETSARNLTVQTGVKAPTAINLISTDANFQDGSVAGWTPNGTTTLSNRILTPGDIKVQEAINPKDINKIWMSQLVSAGSYEDSIPFEQYYVQTKLDAINKNSEKAIWLGDTASGDANLNKFDGFLKIIDDSGEAVDGNTSAATEITKDNVVQLVDDMYAALPSDVLEATDLRLAVGYDVARLFVAKHKDLDMRNYDKIAGTFEFEVPGSNVRMFATSGLNGTSRMILGSASNMVIGVDLENDEEAFSIRYSEEEFVVKYHANFKKATQVAYPSEIVEFTLSA
ncbi:hypothetical protein AAU57_08840 [Nonlabens sp. YIK11]|uniref:hypothetical protein n=1 Tax=Nonlabens sp. YIK11 TaxID=1453349 RepID=UPI0006DD1101|nr:hypothetical protein [Nonlabens sp. YIK11]KQC33409.1 hypothetical protein AAU57_08840 [Nonlabens sp. YIK11]